MRRVDTVVIGQGLAGTTLAWQLRRLGLRALAIDREDGVTSSRIAAGLITPVTGKRLAKSWRWDELNPVAASFYRAVEAETGSSFFHQRPALRLFAGEPEREEYGRRAAGMLATLVEDAELDCVGLSARFGGFAMPAAARLDVPRYLDASRTFFAHDDGYVRADLDLARDVELVSNGVRLPRLGIEASALALCRGYTSNDPWFDAIQFNAAKGEILTVRIPGLTETRVVHRGVWLAPVEGDIYRAGSTYAWDDLTCEPTPAGRAEIETRLREFLRLPFEVIDHRAAVRPVIDAGYPVLGRHPRHPQLAYFNGLGSKGSLLAPYFAAQLAANIADNSPIECERDVGNFYQNS